MFSIKINGVETPKSTAVIVDKNDYSIEMFSNLERHIFNINKDDIKVIIEINSN